MRPGGPLKQTTQPAAGQTRDVSIVTVAFNNFTTYSRQSTVRQQALKDTSDYAATCGLGKAGAESIGLAYVHRNVDSLGSHVVLMQHSF